MDFTSIPAELRLSIADYLDPSSSLQFALVCRENYRLCSSLLAKHRDFYQRYRTLNNKNGTRMIWDVTKDIIETPSIAQYIEDFSLPFTGRRLWHDANAWVSDIDHRSPATVPEDIVNLYLTAAKRDPILEETLGRFHSVRTGADTPAVALLLSMTYNLRTLRFTEPTLDPDVLDEYIERVSLAYKEPARGLTLPFQSLTTVAVAFADTENCCNPDWVVRFLRIPTIQNFVASDMGGDLSATHYTFANLETSESEDDRSDLVSNGSQDYQKSNVKELLFLRSLFVPEAIEEIVRSTKALEKFTYEDGGFIVCDEGCFSPRRVVQALVSYAAHSLEELVLFSEVQDDWAVSYSYSSTVADTNTSVVGARY